MRARWRVARVMKGRDLRTWWSNVSITYSCAEGEKVSGQWLFHFLIPLGLRVRLNTYLSVVQHGAYSTARPFSVLGELFGGNLLVPPPFHTIVYLVKQARKGFLAHVEAHGIVLTVTFWVKLPMRVEGVGSGSGNGTLFLLGQYLCGELGGLRVR